MAGIVTVITVLWKVQNSFATPAPAENRRGEHGKVEFAELAREYTEFYIQKLTQQVPVNHLGKWETVCSSGAGWDGTKGEKIMQTQTQSLFPSHEWT